MDAHGGTLGRIVDGGVVAVLRGVDAEDLVDVADAVVAGGVTALEVTADSADATGKVGTLAERFADREDVVVGAGTVLDAATARATIDAGAEFVVSPTLSEGVVATCNRYGVVSAPGVFTPTEALRAVEAGADVVKVFPATTGGPEHVAAIRGPLEQVPIVPTGGVDVENAAAYVEAGAVAVGVGSALVPDDPDPDAVAATARDLVATVQSARD